MIDYFGILVAWIITFIFAEIYTYFTDKEYTMNSIVALVACLIGTVVLIVMSIIGVI